MPNKRTLSNWPLPGYPVMVWDEDGNMRPGDIQAVTLVDADGNPISMGGPASSVTESSANVTTSSQTLIATNANRVGGYLQNVSDTLIYYSYSGTATISDFKLFQNQSLPFQFGYNGPVYTGQLSFIHAGTGSKAIKILEVE